MRVRRCDCNSIVEAHGVLRNVYVIVVDRARVLSARRRGVVLGRFFNLGIWGIFDDLNNGLSCLFFWLLN